MSFRVAYYVVIES